MSGTDNVMWALRGIGAGLAAVGGVFFIARGAQLPAEDFSVVLGSLAGIAAMTCFAAAVTIVFPSAFRTAVWAVRVVVAAAFTAFGVMLLLSMRGLELETGALLFVPIGLFGALFCFGVAIGALVPRSLRGGGGVPFNPADLFNI